MGLCRAYRCIDYAAQCKISRRTLVVDSLVTVFFWELPVRLGRRPSEKIDRLIPIVAETEQNRGPSKLVFEIKSANFRRIGETVLRRAQKKFALKIQRVTIA